MNKRESDDLSEQHISDGGGYRSVYHKTTNNLPEEFSGGIKITRDPDDALTISSLLRAVWIMLAILTVSFGLNIFLAVRKADRIVVDKTSGRVVELNNRDYGATETVEIAPDRPNETDKKYLVKEFLKSLYEVEQTTRESQVNKLLRMLDADLSLSLATRFKQNGILAAEKAESVNSSWELQDLSVDERDPFIVRALGKRVLRRVQNGTSVEEETQIKIKFLLMDSPTSPARNDNNYRTGFYIQKYRAEAVDGTRKSALVLLSDERTSGNETAVTVSENRPHANSATSGKQ